MTADQLIAQAAHGVAHIDDPRARLAEQVGRLQGVVRTLAAKLATYTGITDPKLSYATVYAGDAELLAEYDYQPEERAVYNLDSPMCGPGCSAQVEICAVLINGQWIEPSEAGFSDDQIERWEQWILDSEIETSAEQYATAMEERAERAREDRIDWSAA